MTASLTIKTQIWCLVGVVTVVMGAVVGLNGDHVCVVQQKYNITKRVKYRAPMSVRTYEWCFSMPPRCSKWSTEMRDLTRLETEERTAEVAVCCPGYKMKDVSCVPICPAGRTGSGCSEECPKNKWGPNCVNECKRCTKQGICSVVTGECQCQDGWQGERCEVRQTTPATMEELSVTKPVNISTSGPVHERTTMLSTTGTTTTKAPIITTVRIPITAATTTTTTLPTTPKPTTTSTTTTSTSTTTTSTTMRPVATTLLTSAPTSTVETTIQSSKSATVEAISNKESTRTTKHTNWNNVTLTSWVLSTDKSVPPTMMPFTTVSPIFIKTTFTKNAETSTDFIKETTARILPSKTENLELPSQSTKIFEMSTMNLRTAKPILITEPTVKEATRRPETTIKIYPTTIKFKPKEIWIKPAQKGELLVETKIKPIAELPKHKNVTKKETLINTTPRTIMVSIIPTSLSYATFKKIALTTASYFTSKNVTGKPTEMFTRSMSTSAPIKPSSTPKPFQNITKHFTEDKNATNSMRTTAKPLTIFSTNPTRIYKTSTKTMETTEKKRNNTVSQAKDVKTTAKPDEEFHILTEPEHITAVMDKPDRSSVDLISVISIAGGVMMTVITVAVVIVMLERCRRPRYEDKMNSIRMEVMIDNNDGPPPYVRNIFNTPLPEPPRAEKCHYQPISTLDRNLKQFMRPVVVQTISPMMLENFRGILECHYDHLPRRSVEYPTLQARCSAAPSLSGCDELRQQRPDSLAESTIEALKCEAKLDVIDNTTSEPLYAEIPCWRPPSEHAIEVVNLNGEAVTEL
ncbi:cell wall protein DAN4-like isoform X1 [Leguminivora glycinivorella]|uniref:cell wall protein DAN4-like isoform X1 n=1 Tax=Leguminivora glycinivorella TaxID=1035111 RepID=UPI00200C14B4|nr:cell wall protein DAN4-like isoform X1 [Leguminivora glycinivorella]